MEILNLQCGRKKIMLFFNGPIWYHFDVCLHSHSINWIDRGRNRTGNYYFFIGICGSKFVMCQYWKSTMFKKEKSGTENDLFGGWGNLNVGVTQIFMGSVLFPLFKTIMSP